MVRSVQVNPVGMVVTSWAPSGVGPEALGLTPVEAGGGIGIVGLGGARNGAFGCGAAGAAADALGGKCLGQFCERCGPGVP